MQLQQVSIESEGQQDLEASFEEQEQVDYFFSVFNAKQEPTEVEVQPLSLTTQSMSPDGKLYLGFNKPFIKPPIKKHSRNLGSQRYYDIKEVIDMSVKSDNAEAETQSEQFSISDYQLLDLTDQSILIQLYF